MSLSWTPRTAAAAAFALSLLYAALRYNVAKGVDWMHLPLWTTNKAMALGGLGLICSSYWSARLTARNYWPCWLGMLGYALAAMHTLSSLLLFSPGNYRKFFDEASLRLNWVGEMSMLCGVISLACFTCAAVTSLAGIRDWLTSEEWRGWQKVGCWGLYFTLGHVLVMGLQGLQPYDFGHWLNPPNWPRLAGIPMPPITLISVLILLATVGFRWFRRRS